MRKQYILLGAAIAASSSSHALAASMEELSKFNPAMSVIFDGVYYYDNADGAGTELVEEHNSALHSDAAADHEDHSTQRGFNLGETEIVLSGSVDPYFDAWMTASLSDDGLELEEAWFRSRNLPVGLQLKVGKFLSGLGYHNEKHAHTWDFVDQNLAYSSLIGDHGLAGKGVQLTWLAPTVDFVQLGAEFLQGDELERFGAQVDAEALADDIAAQFNPNGTGEFTADELNFRTPTGPLLSVAFMRFGPDLGTEHALQLGISYAHHSASQSYHEEGGGDAFAAEGDADLYAAQAVFKRFASGDYGKGSYAVQGEYLRFASDQTVTFHTNAADLGLPLTLKQDAAYVQANYGFAPRWLVSVRSAVTGMEGEINEAGARESTEISRQNSFAITWSATEFSRLRLQFNRNDIADDSGDRDRFNQIMLQYNLSLGAHGAHAF